MRGLSSPPTLPKLSKQTQIPQGPKIVPKIDQNFGGPGDVAPPGFLTGQNSLSEWYVYWALAKIFGEPQEPRKPPFYGGFPFWGYQVAQVGGYTRQIGSAVVDFVVYQGRDLLGIRLQTEHFHIYADATKQAYDELQRATLERSGIRVIDLYDNQILGDPSGQKCIIACKQIINRQELLNPDIGGTAIRGSRLKWLRT